jgi:hypothetical protein
MVELTPVDHENDDTILLPKQTKIRLIIRVLEVLGVMCIVLIIGGLIWVFALLFVNHAD